jgi:hypothetical protein
MTSNATLPCCLMLVCIAYRYRYFGVYANIDCIRRYSDVACNAILMGSFSFERVNFALEANHDIYKDQFRFFLSRYALESRRLQLRR